MCDILCPGGVSLAFLGGMLGSTRGVVEVDAFGKLTLELRKPKNISYKETIELFERLQLSFIRRTRIGKVYKDIETVAGKGLFVAQNDDAILIMRHVHGFFTSVTDHPLDGVPNLGSMKPIIDWWDAGKPIGAPLKALMNEVNDPLKPAVLQSKLDGNELCGWCGAKNGKRKTLKQCAGCKIPVYCCKECQERDWSSHKQLCKATRELAKINLM